MAIADENVFILLENSSYGFNNRGGLIYWEALLSVLILRKRKVPEPNGRPNPTATTPIFLSLKLQGYIKQARKFSPVFGVTINNSHSWWFCHISLSLTLAGGITPDRISWQLAQCPSPRASEPRAAHARTLPAHCVTSVHSPAGHCWPPSGTTMRLWTLASGGDIRSKSAVGSLK